MGQSTICGVPHPGRLPQESPFLASRRANGTGGKVAEVDGPEGTSVQTDHLCPQGLDHPPDLSVAPFAQLDDESGPAS